MDREYGSRRHWDRKITVFLGLLSLYSPDKTWRNRSIVGHHEYTLLKQYDWNTNTNIFLALQKTYSKGETWRDRTIID